MMLQSLHQPPSPAITKTPSSSSSSSSDVPPSPLISTNNNPTTATTNTSKRSSSPSSPSPRPLKQQATDCPSSSRPLRLLTLLLQCAESVSVDNLPAALSLLPEISSLSSPFGSSPERVAAYFSDALRSRILSSYLSSYSPLPLKPLPLRIPRSFHLLNSLTPLLQFSHFTSNQAIFQSLLRSPRLHIIDLDIMQGLQWPALFHLLASSSRSPPIQSLRITGIGPDSLLLRSTGLRLADFAASLNLPFHFTPLEGKLADLAAASAFAPRDPADATVVHWTQHCLYDVTGSDLAAARFLAALRPRLFTVVEQDLGSGGGGGGGFLGRFVEALHYYSALFDAIGDGGGGAGDQERWEVERGVLGGEIRNIVAVGGPKRTGEVRVESWGDELRRLGFRQVSLAGSPAAQASLLLGMVPWKGYTLAEEGGRLKLGWKDLSLLTASAWRPAPNGAAGEEEEDGGVGEEDWEKTHHRVSLS